MNAAEKARLAKKAKKDERKEKWENFWDAVKDHWVVIVIIAGILVLAGLGVIFVPKIVDSCKAAYNRTHITVDGVVYAFKDGTYTASSIGGGLTDVTIKGEINDLPVTRIKRNIAKRSTTLKTVTIETATDMEMEIARKAFYKCTTLQEVIITGGGTANFKDKVFTKSTALKQITVRGATAIGEINLFDEDRAASLTITIENGAFLALSDEVKRVEISGGSAFTSYVYYTGKIAKECVLLGNIRSRSEDRFGNFGGGFVGYSRQIASIYYISADVTELPDLFGEKQDVDKFYVYYGGTEAQWNALTASEKYSGIRGMFDVKYEVSYEDFNNR